MQMTDEVMVKTREDFLRAKGAAGGKGKGKKKRKKGRNGNAGSEESAQKHARR